MQTLGLFHTAGKLKIIIYVNHGMIRSKEAVVSLYVSEE